MNKKQITLAPLTPRQVYEDQMSIQKESDTKKKMRVQKKERLREKQVKR